MVNTLSLFSTAPGSSTQGTSQTVITGPDQSKTTGNPSNNPFLKIFRDQSVVISPLTRSAERTPTGDPLPLSDLEALLGNLLLSDHAQPYPYHVPPIESNGILPEDASPNLTNIAAVEALQGILAVEPGFDGVPVILPVNQPGLQFPVEGSNQALPVGSRPGGQPVPDLSIKTDPQQVLLNAVEALHGKSQSESVGDPGKTDVKTLNPVQAPDKNGFQLSSLPIENHPEVLKPAVNPAVNPVVQVPLPFDETPAGLATTVQLNQDRLKSVSGQSPALSESSVNGKESALGIPLDLLGEGNGSLTGDRSREGLEVTSKTGGIDPNGGQALSGGMGGSPHSQSGFFPQSSSPSPSGQAVRIAEERVQDLPGPALQRLQMEVQLSENNRVQIDVGVQHRQVYASLLMDQATLKNLAVQYVPQLEEQLTQGDMELQEFSAEVRDHLGEKESNTQSHGQGMQASQRRTTSPHQGMGALSSVAVRAGDHGLHLVA